MDVTFDPLDLREEFQRLEEQGGRTVNIGSTLSVQGVGYAHLRPRCQTILRMVGRGTYRDWAQGPGIGRSYNVVYPPIDLRLPLDGGSALVSELGALHTLDRVHREISLCRKTPDVVGSPLAVERMILFAIELRALLLGREGWTTRAVAHRLLAYGEEVFGSKSPKPFSERLREAGRAKELGMHMGAFADRCMHEQDTQSTTVGAS